MPSVTNDKRRSVDDPLLGRARTMFADRKLGQLRSKGVPREIVTTATTPFHVGTLMNAPCSVTSSLAACCRFCVAFLITPFLSEARVSVHPSFTFS